MAAPLQNIHLHQRRIGQLQKGNFVHQDFRQPAQRIAAGEDMKAIEDDTERRAVDAFHPFPGLIPAVDVRSPGQRFVADDDLSCSASAASAARSATCSATSAEQSGCTLLHRSNVSQPSSCIRANLRFARSIFAANWLRLAPSKSRKG